ncbi:MAG: hypothetical protein JSV90_05415 [Methanobacteriota archaeon]|nr:MAG: hypothetical protein JSV90_05415 [Euryarchaeota archaeon]
MAKKFEYSLRGDRAMKLTQIKQKAGEKEVLFEGDLKRGKFSGGASLPFVGDMTVRGRYRIVGDKIIVTVLKKPSLYTWDQIDSMMKGFIESEELPG